MQGDGDRRIAAGAGDRGPAVGPPHLRRRVATAGGYLPTDIEIRRDDGGSTTRRVDLEPAALVLDVAATPCSVRPGLRDHELSGRVWPNTARNGAGG